MQKAHLYEAISLLNHGLDEAIRGLERLRKALLSLRRESIERP
jgi:hypothetical protein